MSFSDFVDKNCRFEGANKIYKNSVFYGAMGYGSYVGENVKLSAEIGRFTSVANNVVCNPGCHPFKEPFATTSPMFFSKKKQNGSTFATQQMFNELRYLDDENKLAVSIGNDCWIGENTFIVGNTRINDGAVIMANAVVSKDVPAYAVVGGVPAKIIGYRYDEDTIKFLLKIKWWENDIYWFREHWELLCNMNMLKEFYKNK